MASRRSAVNNTEAISDSPSHTVVQFGRNRRTKKRERTFVNLQTEVTDASVMDNDLPSSDTGGQRFSIHVTGPADWAVTETSSRQQKTEDGEDSERGSGSPSPQHQSVPRRHPRTAWSDDGVVLTRSDENLELLAAIEHNGSTYVNSGFEVPTDDDTEQEYSVGEMLEELQRKIEDSESRIVSWKEVRAAAERDAVEARQVRREKLYIETETEAPDSDAASHPPQTRNIATRGLRGNYPNQICSLPQKISSPRPTKMWLVMSLPSLQTSYIQQVLHVA